MSPSRPFILRPVATSLLMAAILLAGFVAYLQLPVSALPEVDYPTIQVVTFYPGASPDVMASAVTAPLERQFGQVPGLNQMTSTSSDGSSIIVLQFSLELNIDVAEQEVQAAINAAQTYLPSDLPVPPIYSKTNPADTPILTLALSSKSIPLSQVEDLADTRFAQKISQLPGVGLVSISGGQKPAVRVRVNPTALSSYGINLEDVRTALQQTSLDQAKGNFDGPQQDYQIQSNDQLLSASDFEQVIIAYHNGSPVKLSDVATVENDVENNRQAAWMNETPAVIVNIQRQPGANIIQVVDRIKKLLPLLKSNLPAAVQVDELTDRTTTIRASVKDVEFELMLTVALVVMVIFLFLRNLSATTIPSVAVPLSIVGTFGVMYLAGFSLNNLTLMALTISTGFVVDDAIVMIENIIRFIEEGDPPLEAALKGSEQIGFTIVSLTISLIAVLIPLLFMGDIVGRLFREFAITLSVTILVSAVVSLTLTPMMCSRLLKSTHGRKQSRFYVASEHAFESIIAFYGKTLQWVLKRQTATLLVAAGTLVLTIVLYIIVPKGFFPVQDTGIIQGISEAAQSISFPAMAEKQQQLAHLILQDPAVESLSSFIGIDGTNTTLNSGRIQINLKPLEERKINASDVIRRLQPNLEKIDGITLYMQPVQDLTVEDRVSRTQYQYTLEDPDPRELNFWTAKLMAKLQTIPELRDLATDQQTSGLAASLVIDRVTASRMGITPQAIDQMLYDAFGQRQVSTLYTQLNQYHIVLETQPEFQKNPSKLQDIYVRSALASTALTTGSSGTDADRDHVFRQFRLLCFAESFRFPEHRCQLGFRQSQRRNHGEWRRGSPQRLHSVRNEEQPPVRQSPGTISRGHHLFQPGAECVAWRSHQGHRQGPAGNWHAAQRTGRVSGHRRFVSSFLVERTALDSRGPDHGLYRAWRSLRELHTPHHHSVDPALCRSGRDSGLVDLRPGTQRRRPHRNHPSDRDRQEERNHDDRLRAGGGAQRGQEAGRRYL